MNKNKKILFIKKNKKGSILAYSLVVLFLMIVIAAAFSSASVIEKKSASSTDFSTQALQTADSGTQIALKKINNNLTTNISNIAGYGGCVNGVVSDLSDAGQGLYTLYFYSDAILLTLADCNQPANKIKKIESIGVYKSTARAISMGVEPVYTTILLHANEPAGSFLDSSSDPKNIVKFGGVNQDAGEYKFGPKSAKFNGFGGYLSIDSSSDFNFGADDFTIEFWEKSNNNNKQYAFSFTQGVTNIDFDFNDNSSGLIVFWNGDNTTNKISAGSIGEYTDNSWHHIALVRKSNDFTLYIDAVSVGSVNGYSNEIDLSGAGSNLYIGTNLNKNFSWNGNMDEIRGSRWIARDFSGGIPTIPYIN